MRLKGNRVIKKKVVILTYSKVIAS